LTGPRRIAIAVAAVLCLALPSQAWAGDGVPWSAPTYLSPTGQFAFGPSVGMLADGSLAATWTQQTGSGDLPEIASRPFGGAWSQPTALASTAMANPQQPKGGVRMAIDGAGRFVAAWLVNDAGGQTEDVVGAIGTVVPGQAPSHANEEFAGYDSGNSYRYAVTPQVAMSLDGTGSVEFGVTSTIGGLGPWAGLDGFTAASPTGGKDPAALIENNVADGTNSDYGKYVAALGTAGRAPGWRSSTSDEEALVVTSPNFDTQINGQDAPGLSAVLYETAAPSTWSSVGAQVLPMSGTNTAAAIMSTGRAIVADDPVGGPVKVWQTGDATATALSQATETPAGKPVIATFDDGTATIAYLDQDSSDGTSVVKAAQIAADGTVGAPRTLSPAGFDVTDLSVAYGPEGTAYVVWAANRPSGSPLTDNSLFASVALPGAGFPATPETVAAATNLGATDPKVVVDQTGEATILAADRDSGGTIRIAAYTHASFAPPAAPVVTGAPVSTVAPAPTHGAGRPARPSVGKVSVSGTTVSVTLVCAKSAASCAPATLTLTYAKTRKKHLTLASAKADLRPGRSQEIKLALSRSGRELLAARRKLKLALTLEADGTSSAQTVKLKAAGHHRKKR
jgi:hypothetical protein